VASALSGFATSFLFLLFTRVALGAVVAVAGPAVASLLGDFFPSSERSRIYSYVIAGELVGTGFGFIVCGNLAAVSWRAAFLALVPLVTVLVWALTRLPEPARGGGDRLRRGTRAIHDSGPPADGPLRKPPQALSLPQAVKYVLRVRSNVVLIVASALGYFFLAGVRGFGVEFVRHHYSLSQSAATSLLPLIGIGMLVGAILGGWLADRALSNGHRTARVTVAAVAVLIAVLLFVPAIATASIGVAIPLLMLCGVGLGGSNPPLDAARLDVMPPELWGRAEAVRTLLRSGAQAAAPLLFGLTASHLGGSSGLRDTFLLSLIPLGLGAILLLTVGRRTYPADAEGYRPP
jgi:MFS family permease